MQSNAIQITSNREEVPYFPIKIAGNYLIKVHTDLLMEVIKYVDCATSELDEFIFDAINHFMNQKERIDAKMNNEEEPEQVERSPAETIGYMKLSFNVSDANEETQFINNAINDYVNFLLLNRMKKIFIQEKESGK